MKSESHNETEALRSDIETTRRRMDDTMDALGNRLQGKHLIDEIVGLFRHRDGDSGSGTGEKIKRSADAALHRVVDTVKANPWPSFLIGAGVAWLVYESTRDKTEKSEDDEQTNDNDGANYDSASEQTRFDPELHVDRPLEYPAPTSDVDGSGFGETLSEVKDTLAAKASSAKDQVKEKLGSVGEKAREKFQNVKESASELGARAKERTREVYRKSKDRVVETADRHPLELGLACLAVGAIAGLALPTPQKVHRVAGPTVDRLRDRTRQAGREAVEKSRRVARAATDAAKEEAEAQGLTLNRLREQIGATGSRAEDHGATDVRPEGLATGGAMENRPPEAPQSSDAPVGDPSVARPV